MTGGKEMTDLSWLPWLIAIVCVALALALWFQSARRIMQEQKSIVDSSAAQLSAARQRAAGWKKSAEADAILERSIRIYKQAVAHYNRTLRKPSVYLPATIMHFKFISLSGFAS